MTLKCIYYLRTFTTLLASVCVMNTTYLRATSITNTVENISLETDIKKTDILYSNISLRVGMPFRPSWTTRDIHRLMSIQGVTNVIVHIEKKQNDISLVYNVFGTDTEVIHTSITNICTATQPLAKIVLKGVSSILPRMLIKSLPLSPPHWLWGEGTITCNSENAIDASVLQVYHDNGFLDVSSDSRIEYSPHKKATLFIDVCEGPQYIIDDVQWKQFFLPSNSFVELKSSLPVSIGTPYSPQQLEAIENTIYRACIHHSSQKPYLSVNPCISSDSSPLKPLVTYVITLAPPRVNGIRRTPLPAKPISLLGLYGL